YSNGPSSRYDRAFSRTHKAEQKRHIEKKSPDAWYIFFIHNQGQKHPDTHDPHVQWSKPEKSSCKESPQLGPAKVAVSISEVKAGPTYHEENVYPVRPERVEMCAARPQEHMVHTHR